MTKTKEERLFKMISKIIQDELKNYHSVQSGVITDMNTSKKTFRKHNERPIAAKMTEALGKKLNCVCFHELPLKGVDETKLDNFYKKLWKRKIIPDKTRLNKKYTRFEVDGYLKLDKLKIFLEYKVNEKPIFMDLLQDFVKYLLYKNGDDEIFVYILFLKGEKENYILKEKYSKIDIEKLSEKYNMEEIGIFYHGDKVKITNNRDYIEEIHVLVDTLNEKYPEDNISIKDEEYRDLEGSMALNQKDKYGNNVIESKLIQMNLKSIASIRKSLKHGYFPTSDLDEKRLENGFKTFQSVINKFKTKNKNTSLLINVTRRSVIIMCMIEMLAKKYNINCDDINLNNFKNVGHTKIQKVQDLVDEHFKEMRKEITKKIDDDDITNNIVAIIDHIIKVHLEKYDYSNSVWEDDTFTLPIIRERYKNFNKIKSAKDQFLKLGKIIKINSIDYNECYSIDEIKQKFSKAMIGELLEKIKG